jgi:endonuclease G
LWVQYAINPEDLEGDVERSDRFRPDTSIPNNSRSELGDYRNSGYDKGHMAPAADMKRSEEAMEECFLLSNIAPQVGVGFNQQIWRELEEAVRGWVGQRGSLFVITGPVFAVENRTVNYKVIGNNNVAVPTHFYKIVVDAKDPQHIDALAFLIANKDLRGHDYSEYLVSIDDIERATGLDFLSALPLDVQEKAESRKPTTVW